MGRNAAGTAPGPGEGLEVKPMSTVQQLAPSVEGRLRSTLARLGYHSVGTSEVLAYVRENGFCDGCESIADEDVDQVNALVEADQVDSWAWFDGFRWEVGPELEEYVR